jgi:hypothetical protein
MGKFLNLDELVEEWCEEIATGKRGTFPLAEEDEGATETE